MVRLSNGWLVAVVKNGTTDIRFYFSTDNGLNWTLLCFGGYNVIDISLVSKGTVVYYFLTTSTSDRFGKFDTTVITIGTNIQTNPTYTPNPLDSGQTAYSNNFLMIDLKTGQLHAIWMSKMQHILTLLIYVMQSVQMTVVLGVLLNN